MNIPQGFLTAWCGMVRSHSGRTQSFTFLALTGVCSNDHQHIDNYTISRIEARIVGTKHCLLPEYRQSSALTAANVSYLLRFFLWPYWVGRYEKLHSCAEV